MAKTGGLAWLYRLPPGSPSSLRWWRNTLERRTSLAGSVNAVAVRGKEGASGREAGGEVRDGREEGPLVLPLSGLELPGGKDGEREVGPVEGEKNLARKFKNVGKVQNPKT